ncbi:hypothetical protein [Sulfurimonas sp.]
MSKLQEVRNKLSSLDEEFYSISAMYNLHIVQLKACYNNSILEAYEPLLKIKYDYVTTYSDNQIVFYSIDDKRLKTINLSIEMFHKIWKLFLKNIEKFSIQEASKSFYNQIKDERFLNTVIGQTTRKYLYLKHKNSSALFYNKIVFVYKFKNDRERDFLKNNQNIWLFTSDEMLNVILKNKDKIIGLKEPLPIKCDPFNKNFCHKIVSDLLKKIRGKTNGKIDIKILNINRQNKILTLSTKVFLPMEFIQYIQNYIYENTLYETIFAKNKTK